MNSPLMNLSFYRFLPLGDLPLLRERLRARGQELALKGTILLAPEGVNAMLSGDAASVGTFQQEAHDLFGSFTAKLAPVSHHSFHRFLVKLKKEIISVGDPDLRPHERTAARISPHELKRWIEEGRSFHLVDTRNAYEIEVGTFRGAEHLSLSASSEFAAKVREKIPQWGDRPVVTFCTGGIRCEKASAVLLKHGLENVYQLDGGILRYFEENGAAHFNGQCFVYDWRLAVDGKLEPAPRSEDPEKDFGRHRLR